MRERPQHGKEREARVHGQKHIVQDDEQVEGARLAEGVGFVPALAVDAVPDDGGGGVEGRDRDRHLVVERAVVDVCRYAERRGEGAGVCRWRESKRLLVWRELEEPAWW